MTMEGMFETTTFYEYFHAKEFSVSDPIEIQQMMLLRFEAKTNAQIAN